MSTCPYGFTVHTYVCTYVSNSIRNVCTYVCIFCVCGFVRTYICHKIQDSGVCLYVCVYLPVSLVIYICESMFLCACIDCQVNLLCRNRCV